MDLDKIIQLSKQADEFQKRRDKLDSFDLANNFSMSQSQIFKSKIAQLYPQSSAQIFDSGNLLFSTEQAIKNILGDKAKDFQNETLSSTRKLIEEIIQPLSKNHLFDNAFQSSLKEIRESLVRPYRSGISDIYRDFEEISRATTLSSLSSLSKSVLENDLIKNSNLLSQISKSLLSYDRFTNDTILKLISGTEISTALALKGSLVLANEQILRTTSIFQSYLETSYIPDSINYDFLLDRKFPRINRFGVQKQELLQQNDIEENEEYGSLVTKSPSASSFEKLSSCMMLIGLCNETSETTNGNTIFTITSALWISAWKLMNVVPTDKDKFAIIIDCLYLMLYEGAGKDKLRFIEQGHITSNEAEFIWNIKHLRNKWLRHDIEHGKASDIKKSYQQRKETLQWFGMDKVPNSKDDFIFLYNNLVFKLEEFLNLLLERVSKFSK